MADNDRSKIRYDDFIGNIQPDPAQPVSTIMLSGFVGRGPEGHARIYPDPTLGTWYDVPEDDVVHSMPIPDSKLGGSHVWIKAGAEIKPGTTAAAPAAMEALPAAHAGAQPLTMHGCDGQAFCANATRIGPPPRGWTHGGWICALPSLIGCTTVTFTIAAAAPAGMGTGVFNPMLAAGVAPAMAGAAAPQQAGLQPTPASDCFFCPPPTLDGRCGGRAMAVAGQPNTAAQCGLPETQQTPCPGWQGTAVCTMMCWTPQCQTITAGGCVTLVLCAPNGVFTPFGR